MEPTENALLKARRRDDDAQRHASETRRILKQAVTTATSEGMTEQRAADLVGVTRLTVRDWIGKPQRRRSS